MKEIKKKYEKPSMKVVELQHRTLILAGSPDPLPIGPGGTPNQW